MEILDAEIILTCIVCFKKFNSIIDLDEHLATHVDNKKIDSPPPLYENRAFSHLSLGSPYKTCPMCGIICETDKDFRKHELDYGEHEEGDCCQCTECFVVYRHGRSLASHIRKTHNGGGDVTKKNPKEASYICETCDKAYFGIVNYDDHTRIHINPSTGNTNLPLRDHICKSCPLSFRFRINLEKHYKLYHKVYYYCKFCTKKFESNDRCQTHIRLIHHPYGCQHCSLRFRLIADYNNHQKVHVIK